MAKPYTYEDFVLQVGQWLMDHYWGPMWQTVKAHPELISVIPGFLIHPEKQIYYMGQTHIGIEYVGRERGSSPVNRGPHTTALAGVSAPAKDARAAWVGSNAAVAHETTAAPGPSSNDP